MKKSDKKILLVFFSVVIAVIIVSTAISVIDKKINYHVYPEHEVTSSDSIDIIVTNAKSPGKFRLNSSIVKLESKNQRIPFKLQDGENVINFKYLKDDGNNVENTLSVLKLSEDEYKIYLEAKEQNKEYEPPYIRKHGKFPELPSSIISDYLKKRAKVPSSVKIIELAEKYSIQNDGYHILVRWSAQNSFGVPIAESGIFTISDGIVIDYLQVN
jgi:hypothetical protein